MWDWLRRLLAPIGLARRDAAGAAVAEVRLVADAVHMRNPDGTRQTLRWQDLGSVDIVTNDSGPFDVDLHWVLTSRDGRHTLAVPLGASGEQALLRELQLRLPGFDNDAVARAMGSTANASFVVWQWSPTA